MVIIVALISICAILALTFLGGDTHNLIKTSSDKVTNFKPFSKDPNLTQGSLDPDNLPEALPGTQNIILENGVILLSIPDSTVTSIQTTGASGDTELITNALEVLANQLKSIAELSPGNVELNSMADLALKMAYEGHLLADAEEWVETAAMRINSPGPLDVPADNLLCESGMLKTEDPSCDTNIGSATFLYDEIKLGTEYDALPKLIDPHISQVNVLNQKLLAQSDTLNDPRTTPIVDVINTLSSQILATGNNVNNLVMNPPPKPIDTLDALNNSVASTSTDIRSALINKYGLKLK